MEKKTPLYQTHVDMGGKIVEFGGFLMPVQYPTGVIAEHMAVREKAGLFDVSHMGELRLKGPDAVANVQKIITADISNMKDGEIILLENTRYRAEETKNGDEFSKELASLCDVFVNDAFGTAHRAHCSNVGVTKYVDTAVVGYLMQKEIDFLGNAVNNPDRPFVAILGGAKVSSKISVINNLLDKVDTLIIGGGMCYTFTKAQGGNVGNSLLEEDYLQYALDMVKKAEEKGVKLRTRSRTDGWVLISDLRQLRCSLMLLNLRRQLYGTDQWDASRCLNLQKEQKRLQKHLQTQTL